MSPSPSHDRVLTGSVSYRSFTVITTVLSSTVQQSHHAHKSVSHPCSPIFLQLLDSFMSFTFTYCAYTCMHTNACTHTTTSICIVHTHACTHMRIYAHTCAYTHTQTMRYNVYIVIIIPYLHDIFTILPSEMKIQRHKIVMQVFAKVLT